MAGYPAILLTCILGLAFCSTIINAEAFSLEEKLGEMMDNYKTLSSKFESLEQRNGVLNAKVTQLEAKVIRAEELELKIRQQQSLLNALQSYQSQKDETETVRSSAGSDSALRQISVSEMPRSCEDLRVRGHLASGLYMVIGNKSVDTVYCDFCKPKNDSNYQTFIGFADIKSAPTYFNVQKNSNEFNKLNTPIPFDIETLNIGGAMNLPTGIFKAPRPGKYVFSFTGVAYFPAGSSSRQYVYVGLYKNYSIVGRGFADEISVGGQWGTFSLQSTLNLKKGDRIWLQIDSIATGVTLTGTGYTHFNGLLLEEEIAM